MYGKYQFGPGAIDAAKKTVKEPRVGGTEWRLARANLLAQTRVHEFNRKPSGERHAPPKGYRLNARSFKSMVGALT